MSSSGITLTPSRQAATFLAARCLPMPCPVQPPATTPATAPSARMSRTRRETATRKRAPGRALPSAEDGGRCCYRTPPHPATPGAEGSDALRPRAQVRCGLAKHPQRHASALPRKRFVKFRIRRFRGNVTDVPASAITIQEASVRGMCGRGDAAVTPSPGSRHERALPRKTLPARPA